KYRNGFETGRYPTLGGSTLPGANPQLWRRWSISALPAGPPTFFHQRIRIVQTPALLALLSESNDGSGLFRTVFFDGRGLPENPNATWIRERIPRFSSGLRSISGRRAAKAKRVVADICSASTTNRSVLRGHGKYPRYKAP